MNFWNPIFLNSADDLIKESEKSDKNFNRNFYVYPFLYNSAEDINKMLLFDFPEFIKIFIHGIFLPAKCFDYFNPLVVSPKHIRFYDEIKKEYVDVMKDMKLMVIV